MITFGMPLIGLTYSNALRNLDPNDPMTKYIALFSIFFWGIMIILISYKLWRDR